MNIIGTPLISPELIPLLSQPVHVGFLSMSFIQDKRDDPIDSHHGTYTSIDLALACGWPGIANRFRAHRGAQLLLLSDHQEPGAGAHHAISVSSSATPGSPEIPLAERFFGGGAFSNRAFPDFQAGPRDLITGFPIGGNALLVNTVELRFPLIGDNLGGVLFNDMGNVYSDVNKISLRFRQHNLAGLRLRRAGLRIRASVIARRSGRSAPIFRSALTRRASSAAKAPSTSCTCGVPGSNVPKRCSVSTSFNSIFPSARRFDEERIQNSEFRIQKEGTGPSVF